MESSNKTSVTNFILLGLSDVPHLQAICFLLFLLIYTITLLGNFLIIVVVGFAKLCSPMYFFLSNLSCVDICLSSTVVPRILVSTLSHDTSISFLGCAAQEYFLAALGATECMILAIMAYDRYTAICHPLHYNTIMNKTFCIYLTLGSWTVSFLNSVIHAFLTFKLPFCRSNKINHFFCEMPPLFRLSCKETLFNEILMYIAAGLMALSSFILTLISYIHIISSILKIKSTRRREKTFYTCASHLIVVMLFYGNILIVYMQPHSTFFPKRDRAVSIFYTAVTPMLNPIIYSIRNQVFLGALRKLVNKKMFLSRLLKIAIT
ncbi:olfactory receptor 1361 [Xenopus laevis]|uniref:Olfactory receptor n=2 Tax=Xenopus laevis TaxID=8355 RepID=A0A974H8T3_XENLA|nr:olfactory receptor 1361 [Xenopus laevis]OCT69107.1 hypothetical protein XELAEV_18040416mg [Xenopus laevis]